MRYALCAMQSFRRGDQTCKSGNAKFAVTSMIQKKAILMAISLLAHLLTNCLTTGFALCAALPKICLKRFRIVILTSNRVQRPPDPWDILAHLTQNLSLPSLEKRVIIR